MALNVCRAAGALGSVVLAVITWCGCRSLAVAGPGPDAPVVAFRNVNVIPVDGERTLPHSTVVVKGERIAAVGPADAVEIPAGAHVIEASGQYLVPGLADMHVHLMSDEDLVMYLANGVTTVRNMSLFPGWARAVIGYPHARVQRDQVRSGQLPGPTIFTSGPPLQGKQGANPFMRATTSPDEARKSVLAQKREGYDFIKVFDWVSPEVFEAAVAAAHEVGLDVVGHVPKLVGVEAAQHEMRSMEHYTGYIDTDKVTWVLPVERLPELAKENVAAGVWNCPTMVTFQKMVSPDRAREVEKQPGIQYLPRMQRTIWKKMLRAIYDDPEMSKLGPERPARLEELFTTMTGALRAAGAQFVVGTDSGNPYTVPGWAFHEELAYYAKAGFTPYQVLEAATANAAALLHRSDEFGTITVGKRADLLLLRKDPLESVSNLRERVGVMARGRWYGDAELKQLLDGDK